MLEANVQTASFRCPPPNPGPSPCPILVQPWTCEKSSIRAKVGEMGCRLDAGIGKGTGCQHVRCCCTCPRAPLTNASTFWEAGRLQLWLLRAHLVWINWFLFCPPWLNKGACFGRTCCTLLPWGLLWLQQCLSDGPTDLPPLFPLRVLPLPFPDQLFWASALGPLTRVEPLLCCLHSFLTRFQASLRSSNSEMPLVKNTSTPRVTKTRSLSLLSSRPSIPIT